MSGSEPPRSPLYTRRGDRGETGLLGKRRVFKHDPRVEAYGAVDELNAWLGLARVECARAGEPLETLGAALSAIQEQLFVVGAELATDPDASPGALPLVSAGDVEALEREIDRLDAQLPPLRAFILPGGSMAAAALHVARTVARRAERRVTLLASRDPVRPELMAYLNRLSDLLFVMARWANLKAGVADVPWTGGRRAGPPGRI